MRRSLNQLLLACFCAVVSASLSSCTLNGRTAYTEIGVGKLSNVEPAGSLLFWLVEWQGQVVTLLSRNQIEGIGVTPEQLVFSTLDGDVESITVGRVVTCNQPLIYMGIRSDHAGRLLMIANCAARSQGQYTEHLVSFDPDGAVTQFIYSAMLCCDHNVVKQLA